MYLIEKALVKLENQRDEEQEEVERICADLFSDCCQLLSKYGKRKQEQGIITLVVVVHKTERPIEILLTSGQVYNPQEATEASINGLNIWIEGLEEHLNLSKSGSKISERLIDTHDSFTQRVPTLWDIQHWREVVDFIKQKHPLLNAT